MMPQFFKVPSDIYRALPFPKNWLYVEICSRVNYGDPYPQNGIVCGDGQCAVTSGFLAYKYCQHFHKKRKTCSNCKHLVRHHLKRMSDVIVVETVGRGTNRLYRIPLAHHIPNVIKPPREESTKPSTKPSTNGKVSEPIEVQEHPPVEAGEDIPMNLPPRLTLLSDIKALEYPNYPPHLDVTCDFLEGIGKQAVFPHDFKKAYGLVKGWVEMGASQEMIVEVGKEIKKTNPIKSSFIGWMQTVAHNAVEQALSTQASQEMSQVSQQMSQEKAEAYSKRMHDLSAKRHRANLNKPKPDPHVLDEEQGEVNKDGLSSVVEALRAATNTGDDDANED